MIFFLPFGFTSLIGYWYYRKSGMARGYGILICLDHLHRWLTNGVRFPSTIRLPGDGSYRYGQDSGILATLASVPWFLLGVLGVAWEHASSLFGSATAGYGARRGYRDVPVDEDAQILHFEDEEE
jgi:hypothetical protein